LGSGLDQTVSPDRTTEYVVQAQRGGVVVSDAALVIVQRTFEEWSADWHEAVVDPLDDLDEDGVVEVMEYARGSDPLRSESGLLWGALREGDAGQEFVWEKSREALGVWRVEVSMDLMEWDDAPMDAVRETGEEIVVEVEEGMDRRFYRLRFQPGT
jgi:hypothetical protein